ncbi:transglycosylase SLT domain-containing protein [Noviherbaspirillum pedocola]|uniref:Transglycosylase SLT domain-containing protein n=1 Tax=Noviherbaspirillum pedocola TaxID=2801341 RepID=A0A934T014_9BURK|nr:transglycosylase SLT domain-containing protein [Noviherbaspirillum pedocola]MBK4735914.1 transglycosylase SLT domain-containing protein [Noviherbaspirillum pedocola]
MAEAGLSWDDEPERRAWTAELLTAIETHLAELEAGNPEAFIAGYGALAKDGKLRYWGELIVAMALYESSWKPGCVYHEPAPLEEDSIGLLQLSYSDGPAYGLEPLNPAADSLKDPLINLRCAVKIMATLLHKDQTVAWTSGSSHKGAARYWSVLWPNKKLDEIRSRVRQKVLS